MKSTNSQIRRARPEDHVAISTVMDSWWGRPIANKLPALFLEHFHTTSLVMEDQPNGLSGFLVGFLSPSEPEEAYIHFIGVSPDRRTAGLAKALYLQFFDIARAGNRTVVKAITSPTNVTSIAFHRRMGFEVITPLDDVSPVRFSRQLQPQTAAHSIVDIQRGTTLGPVTPSP